MESKTQFRPEDRFENARPVDTLRDFVNANTDASGHDECVHIFPNYDGTVDLYRIVGDRDDYPSERVAVRIEAAFGVSGTGKAPDRRDDPESLCLHANDASTALTLFRCLANERSPATPSFDYWPVNNSPMVDESDLTNETLSIDYKTDSGRSHRVGIDSLYTNGFQSMASY